MLLLYCSHGIYLRVCLHSSLLLSHSLCLPNEGPTWYCRPASLALHHQWPCCESTTTCWGLGSCDGLYLTASPQLSLPNQLVRNVLRHTQTSPCRWVDVHRCHHFVYVSLCVCVHGRFVHIHLFKHVKYVLPKLLKVCHAYLVCLHMYVQCVIVNWGA